MLNWWAEQANTRVSVRSDSGHREEEEELEVMGKLPLL